MTEDGYFGAGLLAGLGMLAIPGVGPVVAAGWLVTTIAGAVAGARVAGPGWRREPVRLTREP